MNLVNKQLTYFELPAISLSGLYWDGISTIKKQFNYLYSNGFNITNYQDIATLLFNEDCILVVRFILDDIVTRYALNTSAYGNLIGISLYAGEAILENFAIEVYNTSSATVALAKIRVEVTPIVDAALGNCTKQLQSPVPVAVSVAELATNLNLPADVGVSIYAGSRHEANVANRLRSYTGRLFTSEMQFTSDEVILSDGITLGRLSLEPL